MKFDERKLYVPGNHVKRQYTAVAHFHLIKELLSYQNINIVADDDSVLQNSIYRVFMDEFRNRDAAYFICQYEKGLTLADAGKKSMKARKDLMEWGKKNKIEYEYINQLATKKILSDIQSHDFCDYKSVGNSKIPSRGSNPIKHPLPDKSEGVRYIYPTSPVDHLSDDDLAKLLVQVNSRAVNNFFQELRRRVLILERPLLSSRGNGMSYIYSNYNPKYAQQIVTIFRTFYNFVWTKKYGSEKLTPAQKLGLVDKKFEFRDIIYFR